VFDYPNFPSSHTYNGDDTIPSLKLNSSIPQTLLNHLSDLCPQRIISLLSGFKTGRTYTEIQKMYWLMGRYSALSVYNKLMLYQHVLKPVWTYGIQLWGCTSQSNRNIMQRFQNGVLRSIVDAPWYIRNDNLHKDLDVETVDCVIKKYAQSHEQRLQRHINVGALQLLNNGGLVRRLKRTKPLELV
jgi:hypothetical protein